MDISVEKYRYTKAVLDFGEKAWGSSNLCNKVGGVALAIFAIVPALALDLGVSAMRWLYEILDPVTDPVLRDPYGGNFPLNIDRIQFFKDALTAAFGFHDAATQRVYKGLIRNEGTMAKGDPPICIYRWTAACLLVHYLRTRNYSRKHQLRALMPEAANVDRLWRTYNRLDQEHRSASLLAALVPGSTSQNALIDQINERTLPITQDAHYKNIYPSATTAFLNS